MKVELENVKPMEIEKEVLRLLQRNLVINSCFPEQNLLSNVVFIQAQILIMRITSVFSPDVVERAMKAIKEGACIVTDTQMAKAGINKRALARYGGEVYCFMSDEDVAKIAKENGTTRATASMDKAATLDKN